MAGMLHAASGRRGLGAEPRGGRARVAVARSRPGCLTVAPPTRPPRAELTIGYADPRPRASIDRGIRTIATNLTSERLLIARPRTAGPSRRSLERWSEVARRPDVAADACAQA